MTVFSRFSRSVHLALGQKEKIVGICNQCRTPHLLSNQDFIEYDASPLERGDTKIPGLHRLNAGDEVYLPDKKVRGKFIRVFELEMQRDIQ